MFLTENETKHINEVCVCVSDWVLSSLQLHTLTDMVLPAARACLSLEGQHLCFLGEESEEV